MTTIPNVDRQTGTAALPPAPKPPAALVGLGFMSSRRRAIEWLTRHYGTAITLRIPVFGDSVMISLLLVGESPKKHLPNNYWAQAA